jgi:hypothetical protein
MRRVDAEQAGHPELQCTVAGDVVQQGARGRFRQHWRHHMKEYGFAKTLRNSLPCLLH